MLNCASQMNFLLKVIAFLLLVINNACHSYNTDIDPFFNKLQHSVEESKIQAFRNAPKDSIVYYFEKFENTFRNLYNDPAEKAKIDMFLLENDGVTRITGKYYYLCFIFHAKLNHERINNNEIMKAFSKESRRIEERSDNADKKYEMKKYDNAQANNRKWHIGDKLSVILPVKFEGDNYKVAKYHGNLFELDDYSSYDDSLKIEGILLQKKFKLFSYLDRNDTTKIKFQLKILKLSNPDYSYYGEKIRVGDTLTFDIEAYGRLIK